MTAADSFDSIAPFYDAVHTQQADIDFYRDLALECDGPVLEVGCGTGRIYLELRRAGVDVTGIDVSADSLDALRDKAAQDDLAVDVRQADMRTFDPEPGREYDLVIIPFRAFLYLQTVDDRLAALESLHSALGPDGRLALNAFVPDPEIVAEHYGEWRARELEVDGERYTHRTRSTVVDAVEQRVRVQTEVLDADESLVVDSSHELSLVSKAEFDLLFRLSPFASWDVFGGFELESLETATQEMVWIAE
ncbi:type 12 methyltransferase [Natrialba hulunbeirensis JCM 10989]|uniref:Type 12 methyltransferase n=1 Tax=Natrialba hulunbeirensis JCM 10989 TaxID=1227493 RepID=M0A991_9EURY|nr:class I SAM-dependent methyltransferase [Natrialba hulunbeirensis]ELY93908.1 type 12 methyltransferase [Natrialba hulunbeirensis JCM 10989]